MSEELTCDAVALNSPNALNNSNIGYVLNSLTEPDLRSILFLLGDFYSNNFIDSCRLYLQWCHGTCLQLREKLSSIPYGHLIEGLSATQNFKLLQEIGECSHTVSNQVNAKAINPLRLFLYRICEEIEDDHLEQLKTHFSFEAANISCAEEVISKLFVEGEICENNFTKLSLAMKTIHKEDIYEKLMVSQTNLQSGVYLISSFEASRFALVINQEKFDQNCGDLQLRNRSGSQADIAKIQELCAYFGFKPRIYNDLKAAEIQHLFEHLASSISINCEIFMTFLLSHGKEGVIYGSDCKSVKIQELIHIMANKSTSLIDKPKVFIVQACQGQVDQRSNLMPENCLTNLETDAITVMPKCFDVFLGLATVLGHVSYRLVTEGSPFISSLVKHLISSWHKEDIEVIMKRVRQEVGQFCYQISPTSSTLRKKIIL